MNESIITYETFRKFQRQEKDNDALQKLPDDFYSLCREWIQRKEAMYTNTKDPSILREIENVMLVMKDILERRERKLLTLALHNVRGNIIPQNLMPSERSTFDIIASQLEKSHKAVLDMIKGVSAASQEMQEARSQATYTKVSMLGPLEPFMGTDGKVYGPVNAGQTIELPADVAQLLVGKKVAALV
ncbi:MAG: DNA replication complex GINS family protein [Candidatus Aenigmarchaeota archaeon]|nr:DNA replication complex GINS family protein [Candidatus Aenigmarchaeota archaeon]